LIVSILIDQYASCFIRLARMLDSRWSHPGDRVTPVIAAMARVLLPLHNTPLKIGQIVSPTRH
jgi:hypothetical protein